MKSLVNPFLWYLVALAVTWMGVRRRTNGRGSAWVRAGAGLTLFVAVLAVPLAGRVLSASLTIAPSSDSLGAPSYIFVLGGGYVPAVTPDQDQLVYECARRVLYAVEIWRRFPTAHLVVSGAAYELSAVRDPGRMVQLMAQTAEQRGVPATQLILERNSRNTREHPIQALKLPGVTPTTPVGVVTTAWHMRRARREFCRYFQTVDVFPVPSLSTPVGWRDLVPSAGALEDNTAYIREWAGIAWYALLAIGQPSSKC